MKDAPKDAPFGKSPTSSGSSLHAERAAPHGVELLVFHHLRPSGHTPTPAEDQLATTMGHDSARLAAVGAPDGWPRYDATDPDYVLDDKTGPANGLHTSNCDFWDSAHVAR